VFTFDFFFQSIFFIEVKNFDEFNKSALLLLCFCIFGEMLVNLVEFV